MSKQRIGVKDLSDIELLLELANIRDELYQNKKYQPSPEYDSEWYEQWTAEQKSLVAIEQEMEAERKARGVLWSQKNIVKIWRKYGTGNRLYWKNNNRSWQWDSDVIAKTDGSHFLTREAIVAMCWLGYRAEKRKQSENESC